MPVISGISSTVLYFLKQNQQKMIQAPGNKHMDQGTGLVSKLPQFGRINEGYNIISLFLAGVQPISKLPYLN